jgi:hypothetical protein
MEQWLSWARGPLFICAMVLLLGGLLRVLALNTASLVLLIRRSRQNGRCVPWGAVLRGTLRAMQPLHRRGRERGLFSVVSVLFHACIIVTPIFLAAHVQLWERGLGLSWPTLGAAAADWLSVVALASALLLFVMRVGSRQARGISRPQDYLWPLLIAVPFFTGLLAMHPALNPLSHDAVMLVHVLSGDLILALIPFTKVSHVALFPATQLVSELGWHLRPGSGQRVALALGKEDEPL